jgi:acyl transferase domain-containing protein
VTKKKLPGHYCRICGCRKPNEAFSGRGHQTHVCRACASKPKQERECVEQSEEIYGYLRQSTISAKNMTRLEELTQSTNEKVAEYARIVLEVAKVKPGKRKRLRVLARCRGDLIEQLDRTGLIAAHYTW